VPTLSAELVGHDVPVSNEMDGREDWVEISLDAPLETSALNSVVSTAASVGSGAIGLARFATETSIYLVAESTKAISKSILDTVVPIAVNAVVSRIDINEIVKEHVDVNEIVAQADITPILDRVPMTEIADYVIEEIDLPSLVRESTGGVADGLLGTLRFQAIQTDNFVSLIVDRILFRKKMRVKEQEVSVEHADI
jgi:hypothetical protein